MILVTGGLGFIGARTVGALLELGIACIASSHRRREPPDAVRGAAVVALDVTDRAAVLALGERHKITGIVHLAGALSNPLDELRSSAAGLANILEAAQAWNVRAVVASALGVYGGVTGAWREDAVIPLLGAPHPISAMKKLAELYVELAAKSIDCIAARISGVYGPGYARASSVPARIAHAAAHRRPLDLTGVPWGTAPDDGLDWCYVKDCGRALALLATAPTLAHRIYNVGSGVATRNGELAQIAYRCVPDAPRAEYAMSANPKPVFALDIARLAAETGFTPQFTAEAGLADYIAWLAQHPA
jgi:UDP-glucose 4-epimerase